MIRTWSDYKKIEGEKGEGNSETETYVITNFRCPDCGKTHKIKVNKEGEVLTIEGSEKGGMRENQGSSLCDEEIL